MATPESRKASNTRYRERHREEIRAKDRERYQQNTQDALDKTNQYKRDNPDYTKQYNTQYQRKRRIEFRKKIFDLLGWQCSKCGFSDWRALQVDHINGGGHSERMNKGGGFVFLKDVIEHGATKYQVLCANCNQIKRHENGENCVTFEFHKE